MAAVNSRTVVVITGPGAVNMDTWINHPNVTSVVMATFPGQESGNAIADVLFGDVNPSAKLPFTVAKKEEDYCCKLVTAEPGLIEYAEGINIGYRWFDSKDIPPLFEFGFGLSYTTFEYSDLKIAESSRSSSSNNNGDDDDKSAVITVSLNVKNTGALDGAEVVQLYLGLPQHTHSAPKNLKGFEKVQLPAGGESVRVEFKLTAHDMSFWDVEKCEEKSIGGGWNLPSGDFKVMVGASSRDIRLTGGFRL